METALHHGINHFDTATGYRDDRSEELVGKFLQGRREQVFLASKGAEDDLCEIGEEVAGGPARID
jgi:aryl-alcohol dehydrogenase-like predicted oxidoreductase